MGFLRDKSKSNQQSTQNAQNTSTQSSTNASTNYSTNDSNSTSVQQSQGQSSSDNQSYGLLSSMLSGTLGNADKASSQLADMLGLNGATGQNAGFKNFLDSSNFNFINDQGGRSIAGNAAAKGLLGSGAFGKSISDYGQNTAKSYLNDYLQQLMGTGNQGIQAGSTISGAGGRSSSTNSSLGTSNSSSSGLSYGNSSGSSFGTSQGTSTGQSTGSSSSVQGLGSLIGQMASAAATAGGSDRRLKKDIVHIGKLQNGLNVYGWTYINGVKSIGVMADEVAILRPDALGPLIDGEYMTVNYVQLRKAA
jgi:hypothetical protein